MTKVLFLLSFVIMLVACFFSWQNRTTFVDTRKARQDIDRTIGSEFVKAQGAANEVVALKASVATASGELETEKNRFDQAGIKLRNVSGEADRTTADLTTTNKDIEKIKTQMESLPPGVTIDTVGESINKLKTTVAENENKAKQVAESVVGKNKELKKASDDLDDIQKRIEERKKLYDRNSLTATIIAVNNDWGFVIIDGGTNKSITPDTKLLVTRGNDSIAKLSIVAVEGNRTVANIVQKSVRPGVAISPGDRVILETLYQ